MNIKNKSVFRTAQIGPRNRKQTMVKHDIVVCLVVVQAEYKTEFILYRTEYKTIL